MFDSLTEEPISRTDKTSAPMASQMPDQYNPDATGEALRKLNIRVKEFKDHHSFRILVCISLWRGTAT